MAHDWALCPHTSFYRWLTEIPLSPLIATEHRIMLIYLKTNHHPIIRVCLINPLSGLQWGLQATTEYFRFFSFYPCLFYAVFFPPYPEVFRTYFWFCAQGSHPWCLVEYYICSLHLGLSHIRHLLFPLYCCSSPIPMSVLIWCAFFDKGCDGIIIHLFLL